VHFGAEREQQRVGGNPVTVSLKKTRAGVWFVSFVIKRMPES
jgi:hypothetical protein